MLQSLSPGLVRTEMPPQKFFDICPSLNPEDIADGVLYVLGAPPHVQVCSAFRISKFCMQWSRVKMYYTQKKSCNSTNIGSKNIIRTYLLFLPVA
jgi:hypothetical protein